ncbi:MAG: hypothetical protein OEZ42_13645 [Gemmatimonadota bacterium]|nr:hypothetical protein [Gemmatimonadota bacterium]
METFAVVILIAVVGLGIAAAAQASNRKPLRDTWGAAATTLGLGCDPGDFFNYPEIHGHLRGCSVRVSTFTKGDDSARHTRYRITYRVSLHLGLRIRERTVFSGVQRLFGKRDLSFGDDELEERLVITATDPDAVVGMLGPVRRRVLRDFYAFFPDAAIDDTTLTWEAEGINDSRERIVDQVRNLVRMAEDLEQWARKPETRRFEAPDESTQHGPEPTSEPKRLPAETELADAGESEESQLLSFAELIDPGWIPSRLSESGDPMEDTPEHNDADGDVIAGRPERTPGSDDTSLRLRIATDHAVLETFPPPNPPTTPGGDDTARPAPAPPPAPTTQTARHDAPTHPRDATELLFGTRLMGDEMERRFAQHLEGRQVLWSGVLRSVTTYPFDHVFGKERGARATFEIAQMEDAYGARQVRAVVRLPEALAGHLVPRVGQRLLFEGTLFRCEAFMRTLYLVDGAVPEIAPPTGGTPTARPARAGPARRSGS